MRVSNARDWLALAALGLVVGAALVWSVVGTLPTAVTGRGVFLRPAQVVDSQTLGAGRLESLKIKPGDLVQQGQIIGKVDQSDVRKRLEQDRSLLAELRAQDKAKGNLQDERLQVRSRQDDSQRKFIQAQQQSYAQSLQDTERLAPLLKRRFDSLMTMRKEGLLADVSPELLQAENAILENDSKATDLRARLQQLEQQTKQLETEAIDMARDSLESETGRANQIRDLLSRIAMNELELERNSSIVSEHNGRVLEVIVTTGQILAAGSRVATIELDATSDPLVAIGYFPVGDGKRIMPGMQLQITPDTVERQRYGGILGTVASVSVQPVTREGTMALVGNVDVVQGMMTAGPYIAVTAKLLSDPGTFSGYAWSSSKGPQLPITPGLTGTIRTTIEQRAPITYILPFLRSFSGIY